MQPTQHAPAIAQTPSPVPWRSYLRATTLAFWGAHVAAVVGVIACGFSWSGVGLAVGAFLAWLVTIGTPYFWEIVLPGAIVGLIVGYATFKYQGPVHAGSIR